MYSIVIVGGGVSAASVVYHLFSLEKFQQKTLLIESGVIGKGDDTYHYLSKNEENIHFLSAENFYQPWNSGSNVFERPNRIKMIVSIFPSTSKEFVRHHGMKGLELYNKLASYGREQQFKLADMYLNTNEKGLSNNDISDNVDHIRLGSLMVCHEEELEDFAEEFELLKKSGFEVEWWNKDKVEKVHGKDANFFAGIFFPRDGIIDSSKYAKKLIEFGVEKGLEVRDQTHVDEVTETKDGLVKIQLNSGEIIYARKVVIATGGLYMDKNLSGILEPCYSYLTAIKNDLVNINIKKKIPELEAEENVFKNSRNSPNFFTFGFTHDWSMSQGYVRISGEDHFSASKLPRMKIRCENLQNWIYERYPFIKSSENKYVNGVYSRTPDNIPILGNLSEESNIFYIVGCNAWGQASLSGAAYLVPALLGERKLTKDEQEMAKFISIRRFNLHRFAKSKPKF